MSTVKAPGSRFSVPLKDLTVEDIIDGSTKVRLSNPDWGTVERAVTPDGISFNVQLNPSVRNAVGAITLVSRTADGRTVLAAKSLIIADPDVDLVAAFGDFEDMVEDEIAAIQNQVVTTVPAEIPAAEDTPPEADDDEADESDDETPAEEPAADDDTEEVIPNDVPRRQFNGDAGEPS